MCAWERENVCERESVCVCVRESMYVRERELCVCERECVCGVRERLCVCVCVWEEIVVAYFDACRTCVWSVWNEYNVLDSGKIIA